MLSTRHKTSDGVEFEAVSYAPEVVFLTFPFGEVAIETATLRNIADNHYPVGFYDEED